MSDTDLIRAAFVSAEVVTADQWGWAAEGGPGWEAALAALAQQPAWWAGGGPPRAVTEYHAKLARALLAAGALAALPRRLRTGEYLVRSELGRGGMGVVFRALDLRTRTEVALKRVRGASRQMASRFRREGEILARLDHPAIARFVRAERLDGHDVLAMEFVPGETASRKVKRLTREGDKIPWPRAVDWTVQVLDALAHAHGRGVVHRDVKPGNIMITGAAESAVKLLDVGLAKCAGLPQGGDLTGANQLLGTSEYMPPEQWTGGGAVTAAADLYALGGTLFFLLTGRSPYAGETTYQQMMQHVSAAEPDVRTLRPDAPAALGEAVRRMMAKNPAVRGTARELTWQLNAVRSAARGPAAAPPRPRPPRQGDSGERSDPSRVTVSLSSPSGGPAARAATRALADGSTAVTTRVWPLLCEMGREVKILAGLAPKRRASVFDKPPLKRVLSLSLAITLTVYDRLRGRAA